MLADFRPFRAWRYDSSKVKAEDFLAPPYDVISSKEQDRLYEKSPFNSIRLILNKITAQDTDRDNRYTRARDFFLGWRDEGVLKQETKPCFYLYRQKFSDPRNGKPCSRSAFLGALRIEPFEKDIVIPHEKTLAKPRADRRSLLEATHTNFSPIFGLFEDPAGSLLGLIPALVQSDPIFEVEDQEGVTHGLWMIDETAHVEMIRQELSSQRIYIADGHHRYTTALNYSQEKHVEDQLRGSDFVYMALVSFHDPGLVLFPTHRLLTGLKDFDSAVLLKKLKEYFDVSFAVPSEISQKIEKSAAGEMLMGLVLSEKEGYLLQLREKAKAQARMLDGKPDIWYELDVNVLAYLIFKEMLGLLEADWEGHLRFSHSDSGVFEELGRGEIQAAFLLKAPEVSALAEMGRVHELMPQKSTYFYPKIASGLLFYNHHDSGI